MVPPRAQPRRLLGWCVLAGLMVVAAAVAYLVQSNAMATTGYHIEQLQRRVQKLRLETRDLESDALQLQSAESVTRRVRRLSLVPAPAAEQLNALTPVAANR